MADEVNRITKVRLQQNGGYSDPYAVGAQARYVTMEDGVDVQAAISALQISNRKTVRKLSRKGKQLIITRLDNTSATLDLLWDRNTDKNAGIVDASGGTKNKGKVWKVGNDGKPAWLSEDKPKTTDFDVFSPATKTANGIKGLVPAPAKGGTNTKFLREDGKWAIPPGNVKNTTNQAGYVPGPSTSTVYYNSFWSVGHVPAGTSATQTNYPNWRNTGVVFVGATQAKKGLPGLVPAPSSGEQGKFLRGDGKWVDTGKGIWKPNTLTQEGYVTAPTTNKNVMWAVDKDGKIGWKTFSNMNLASSNKDASTILCGDGAWRSANNVLATAKSAVKTIFARRNVSIAKDTNVLLRNGSNLPDTENWKLLTLNGTADKGNYLAIATVSIDTREAPFQSTPTNDQYVASSNLEGYLRAVVHATNDSNFHKVVDPFDPTTAPSQNTITKYGGAVTVCYEWTYDGSEPKYITLIARYNATSGVTLKLCYNVIIIKL